MDLIIMIVVLVLIGFLVYLLTTKVPMPPYWATAIQLLALIMVILWVVTHFMNVPNVMTR